MCVYISKEFFFLIKVTLIHNLLFHDTPDKTFPKSLRISLTYLTRGAPLKAFPEIIHHVRENRSDL